MDEFTSCEIQTDEASIFVRYCGSGTPILLLHGFPQTRLMWRGVAPLLARNLEVRVAYVRSLRDPRHAHAICEECRAAATIYREHDRSDRASGRRIVCPLLVLWSAHGALENWYVGEGRPIALWRAWGDEVRGRALNAGHFSRKRLPNKPPRL